MKYSLHITKSAEIDLIRASDYIEYNLLNPQASNDLLDKVEEAFGKLSQMPQIHQLIDDPVLKPCGIRYVLIDNYMAFYKINEETKNIYIIRFLYGKRNWIEILKNEQLSPQ